MLSNLWHRCHRRTSLQQDATQSVLCNCQCSEKCKKKKDHCAKETFIHNTDSLSQSAGALLLLLLHLQNSLTTGPGKWIWNQDFSKFTAKQQATFHLSHYYFCNSGNENMPILHWQIFQSLGVGLNAQLKTACGSALAPWYVDQIHTDTQKIDKDNCHTDLWPRCIWPYLQ